MLSHLSLCRRKFLTFTTLFLGSIASVGFVRLKQCFKKPGTELAELPFSLAIPSNARLVSLDPGKLAKLQEQEESFLTSIKVFRTAGTMSPPGGVPGPGGVGPAPYSMTLHNVLTKSDSPSATYSNGKADDSDTDSLGDDSKQERTPDIEGEIR
jgi:hypothetical protein